MPPPIARMYSSHETALSAANELKERGFNADSIHVVAPSPSPGVDVPPDGHGHDAALASVLTTGLASSVAPIYAERIRKGEALVVVHPFFGKTLPATAILHRFEPIALEVPEVATLSTASGAGVSMRDPAPFSRLLGWPVLSSDPTPLSSYLKWPTLKRQPASSRTLTAIRNQSDDPAPLSKRIGMPVLTAAQSPLSRRLVLSQNPAPLSSRLGWRVLLDDPAPLSRLLGLRVLLKHKRKPVRYVRYL